MKLLKKPISVRRNIPFYLEKTEEEFRNDPYERYDEMVVRQTALHLADQLWNGYPFESVFDFIAESIPQKNDLKIAEIGCGVGRMIGELAKQYPNNQCFGIDYSYQMLRRAREFWLEGKIIELDYSNRGFEKINLKGISLPNLELGLAKAEDLPFENESLDVLFSSFLIDRLDDPIRAFQSFHRVLKEEGILIFVSPLNFQKKEDWASYFPNEKLTIQLQIFDFQIDELMKNWLICEPLDRNGNSIYWNCLGLKSTKN
jgi:ubiquinone/menaquinone biosynthesis C-methylase UbiE